MKKIVLFVAALVPFVSCQKIQEKSLNPEPFIEGPTGTISVSLVDGSALKGGLSTAYVEELPYENKVNNVQLFVFESGSGVIVKKLRFTENFTAMNVEIVPGNYEVFALVNAREISDVTNKSLLANYGFDSIGLNGNSVSGSNFIMGGSNECTVTASVTSECKISVSRYVSRVALKSIKFDMPEGYVLSKINCVYLGNVPGKVTIDGSEPTVKFDYSEQPLWYNMGGRNQSSEFTESDKGLEYKVKERQIINGKSTAELAELT